MNKLYKILLVDDDENILQGYRRIFRGKYNLLLAHNAKEAAEILRNEKDIAVIISDFNMPGTKGIEFLKIARKVQPLAVRIMLTGFANLDMAINAVNEGHVFRFLTKPAPFNILSEALEQSVEYYKLRFAEKQLLEETLRGVVKVLTEILSTVNPLAFHNATYFKNLAERILNRLGEAFTWDIEITCLLSQIGSVGIPQKIFIKKDENRPLTPEEEELLLSHPKIGEKFLKNIPRLNFIAEVIAQQYSDTFESRYDNPPRSIKLAWQVLKLLNTFYDLVQKGYSDNQATQEISRMNLPIDEKLIEALNAEIMGIEDGYIVKIITHESLKEGMILAENLYDTNGFLLLGKGAVISEVTLVKVLNYAKTNTLKEPIKIMIKINK